MDFDSLHGAEASFHDAKNAQVDELLHCTPDKANTMLMGSTLGNNLLGKQQNELDYIPSSSNGARRPTVTNPRGVQVLSTIQSPTRATDPKYKLVKFDITKSAVTTSSMILKKIQVAHDKTTVPVSELTNLLKIADGDKKQTVGNLKLNIYLPDRSLMAIAVHDSGTVESVIKEVIKINLEQHTQNKLYTNSDYYELRLHDEDGLPDEDCPALDRKRKILSFQDKADEKSSSARIAYCLCEVSGVAPKLSAATLSSSASRRFSSATAAVARRSESEGGDSRLLKVVSADQQYTIIQINAVMVIKDLLPILEKRKHLTAGKEYAFKVKDEDKSRLNMLTNELDLNANIRSLMIDSVDLTSKVYADTPAVREETKRANDRKTGSIVVAVDRPDLDSFMFNDHTASTLQEWVVIKTNTRGRRQERIMGIDQLYIHNRRLGETHPNRGLSAVKRALNGGHSERAIKDILNISFISNNPAAFRMTYKEGLEDKVTLDYEAQTARDAAEIVAKIQYIQRHILH